MQLHGPLPADDDAEASAGHPEPAESDDGVDLTLIRWMLSLTPTERLAAAQAMADAVEALRKPGSG